MSETAKKEGSQTDQSPPRESSDHELAIKQQALELERWRQEKELTLKEQEFESQCKRAERELALKERQQELDRQRQEKELALKEQEQELLRQRQVKEHGWWSRWNTPTMAAIVAGFIGIIATLLSSHEGRNVERQKLEGTLILDAIKMSGSPAEREKLAAANLVFLADAGLISTIPKDEIEKLRGKAGETGPSLPSGIDFQRFSELQSKLQSAIRGYEAYLTKVGYDPKKAKERVVVRIDEDLRDNAYFDNTSVVVSANLARDPEYVLSEYTWFVLKQVNPQGFQAMWNSLSSQFVGFGHGLKFYFTSSYLNEPLVGRNYYSLSADSGTRRAQSYLFNLARFKAFQEDGGPQAEEPHQLGEIWGGALWELRMKFGAEKVDRLAMTAWKELDPAKPDLGEPSFLVELILQANKSLGQGLDEQAIRSAFDRRQLK